MERDQITETHYKELVSRQVEQYKETEVMHDLSPIYYYWSSRHISRRVIDVTGYDSVVELYGEYFKRSLQESDSNFLISIGAGDCSIEIEIVKYLLSKGVAGFFFICLELSPLSVERARKKIDREELGDIITVAQIDLNRWTPRYSFAGVMAHHSLHHILELESLFGLIKNNLAANGRFVSCDIIGRNGHMRWPEALGIIRKIWQKLPKKYKYSNQQKKYIHYFENWDCSAEGFEGIRAQDILPLLIKNFHFETFCAYGNLIDTFVDRNFGPNYDPADPSDTAFIDYLQMLDDKLISEGILKPTTMIAVMTNKDPGTSRIYKHWSPSFAVRDPGLPAPACDIDLLLKNIPLPAGDADDPLVERNARNYSFDQKVLFFSDGLDYLEYGWSTPEPGFIWSTCEDAAFVLPLDSPVGTGLMLTLEFVPYRSPLHTHSTIDIAVNNRKIETLRYPNDTDSGVITAQIPLAAELVRGCTSIEVAFVLPGRRQPQFEPGGDIRALGIALVSAMLSKL